MIWVNEDLDKVKKYLFKCLDSHRNAKNFNFFKKL